MTNVNLLSAAQAAVPILANHSALAFLDAACIIDGVLQPMPAASRARRDRARARHPDHRREGPRNTGDAGGDGADGPRAHDLPA
jgi:hypothetical protein